MVRFSKMGVMCINGEIQGVCQNCLWLEWNPQLKVCTNSKTCFCPRREQEEFVSAAAGARF
jgi:hypothetical protein